MDVRPRLDECSDAALALAIARYEQAALTEAYERHGGAVFALARRLLIDRAAAEEVVQEVFLRLWNDPTRYDPARSGLRSYLLIDTHGRAVDRLRSENARRQREDRDVQQGGRDTYDLEREVTDLVTAERVREAVESLPETEREAIQVAYFGGLTYREVAARLGVAEGTIKSRIRSGLQRLGATLTAAGVTAGEV